MPSDPPPEYRRHEELCAQYLRTMAQEAGFAPNIPVPLPDFEAKLGVPDVELGLVRQSLRGRGLIKLVCNSPSTYSLTETGWATAKEHLAPEPPIAPPSMHIIQNTGVMGPVQQGGSGNIQHAESFEVTKEDKTFLENASKLFCQILGEKGTVWGGWLFSATGVASISGALLQAPSFLVQYADVMLFAGVGGLVFGMFMLKASTQRRQSHCKECGTHYSLEEVGTPTARDVRVPNGASFQRTTMRHYECRNCGKTIARKSVRTVEK